MGSSADTLLFDNPFRQFAVWFEQAKKDTHLEMPEAMCLSTLNARGAPTARMVLLKDADARGFTFFTYKESPKSLQLKKRPFAALTFHWASQRRQIRVEGKVVAVPKKIADAYFATRAHLSQVGALVSRQSQPLKSREVLLEEFDALKLKYEGEKVPAPAHWIGFRVEPARIEFWQERPNRLHDRWLYTRKTSGRWQMTRLYP